MTLDTSIIGIAAARLMDELGEEYPGATIEAAGVVVDISHENEDGEDQTAVQWKFVSGHGESLSSAHAAGIVRFMSYGFGGDG